MWVVTTGVGSWWESLGHLRIIVYLDAAENSHNWPGNIQRPFTTTRTPVDASEVRALHGQFVGMAPRTSDPVLTLR